MPFAAGLARVLRHKVTIKRNTTSVSGTGATKFNWATIKEHQACAIMDGGGRMRQTEPGQIGGRKASGIFPAHCTNIQENDLVIVEPCGERSTTYKVYHVFAARGPNGVSHYQVGLEVWAPAGDP